MNQIRGVQYPTAFSSSMILAPTENHGISSWILLLHYHHQSVEDHGDDGGQGSPFFTIPTTVRSAGVAFSKNSPNNCTFSLHTAALVFAALQELTAQ